MHWLHKRIISDQCHLVTTVKWQQRWKSGSITRLQPKKTFEWLFIGFFCSMYSFTLVKYFKINLRSECSQKSAFRNISIHFLRYDFRVLWAVSCDWNSCLKSMSIIITSTWKDAPFEKDITESGKCEDLKFVQEDKNWFKIRLLWRYLLVSKLES